MKYRYGSPDTPKDVATGRKWLLIAAEKDHPEAMLEAGQLLAWGYGGPQEQGRARQMLLRAKQLGAVEADVHLNRMEKAST